MTDTDAQKARDLAKAITDRFGPHLKEWTAGWRLGLEGGSAVACPYGPTEAAKMDAWLSGFVMATDERDGENLTAAKVVGH